MPIGATHQHRPAGPPWSRRSTNAGQSDVVNGSITSSESADPVMSQPQFLRQVVGKPRPQPGRWQSAHLLCDDLAIAKQNKGGDRLSVESAAQVRRLVDVDLDELQPSGHLGRKLLQD